MLSHHFQRHQRDDELRMLDSTSFNWSTASAARCGSIEAVANVTASRVSTNKMRRLRVFQRDRYVSIDFQTRQALVSRRTQTSGAKPVIDVESYQAGDEEPLRLELLDIGDFFVCASERQ